MCSGGVIVEVDAVVLKSILIRVKKQTDSEKWGWFGRLGIVRVGAHLAAGLPPALVKLGLHLFER